MEGQTYYPKLTEAGRAAALTASNTGVELGVSHVGFGTAQYVPDGSETALIAEVRRITIAAGARVTPTQIRIHAIWNSDDGTVPVGEIGFFAGDVLLAVFSRVGGPLVYKTDGVPFVQYFNLSFAQLPENSITVIVDAGQDALVAMLGEHETDTDPHPQYVTGNELDNALSAHEAKDNPHPLYLTAEEGGEVAAAAITNHEEAADPHPQYINTSELDFALNAQRGLSYFFGQI